MEADESSLTRIFTKNSHFKSILDNLNEQRLSHIFCDVILRVGKEEVYAHSSVLAAASPYFGTFLGRGQDHPRAFSQKTPQIIEIHIDGSGDNTGYADAVSIIVDYMYSGKIELNSKILIQVVEIAKIMQMETILDYCNQFTSGKIVNETLKAVNTQTENMQTSDKAMQTDTEDIPNSIKGLGARDTPKLLTLNKNSTKRQKIFSTHVNIRSIHHTNEKWNGDLDLKEKEDKSCSSNTTMTTINTKGDIIKRKGTPPMLKINSLKKIKTEDSDDTYLEEVDSSKEALDENLLFVVENLKKEPPEQDGKECQQGKIMPRKTRGKKPLKFRDNGDSDSDALVVNESETESQESQFQRAELLVCEECPYSTYSTYHFGRHQQAHERDGYKKLYNCDRCDFSAQKLKTLQDHKKEHLHAKNICSFCDIELNDIESIKAHLSVHKPPLPYHCLFCNSKYKTRSKLDFHLVRHLDRKPFTCEICKAGFKWKHALKSHMTTHSETKEHLCDVCGFATAHKSQLKAHKLIHTGDTFKCQFPNCQFQSIKKQSLKYHMLTHTQVKAHQCEICGQSFSLVKNLKRHSLLHTNERPYKCTSEGCEFAASRYDKLKDHLLKIHGIGKVPGKKFRLSDYPKSLVPASQTKVEEEFENIIHIDHLPKTDNEGNAITTKVYIQQPGGETIPITLLASKFQIPYQFITRLEN